MSKARLIFVDLDNTILFSSKKKREGDECVEMKLGKEQGFINYDLLQAIYSVEARDADTYVVGITTRSSEQFIRTEFSNIFRYAMCANGAILYSMEIFDEDWYKETFENIGFIVTYIYSSFQWMNNKGKDADFCRLVDNSFAFIKSSNKEMLNKMYNELDKANDKEDISSDIRLYLTDTKLTMMPTFLNKGKAVERFIETFKRDVEEDGKEYDSIETFAFGDNDLDLEMLEKVDHAYCEKSLADKLSKIRADFETFDTRCDKVLTDLIKEGA